MIERNREKERKRQRRRNRKDRQIEKERTDRQKIFRMADRERKPHVIKANKQRE